MRDGSCTIAFAGGGTGGHLYPALAVAGELRARVPGVAFVFFTTPRSIDQNVLGPALNGTQFALVRQPVKPLRWKPWTWPAWASSWRESSRLCRDALAEREPAIVIGSGGYASLPPMRAAQRMGIPTALLNPDAVPGRANRLLGGRAELIFAQWEETRGHFHGHEGVCVTGCPVRPAFREANREKGLARFGLDARRKTLLVTGASQGARTINAAVMRLLGEIAEFGEWQVLHLTGTADAGAVARAYRVAFGDEEVCTTEPTGPMRAARAAVAAYTDHMAEALAAADLVLARAGASTLAELTALGRASVLMPYPFHRDQHQLANARALVRAGAARLVPDRVDAATNAAALRSVLLPLLSDDVARERMAASAARMGTTAAAAEIAQRIVERIGVVPACAAGVGPEGPHPGPLPRGGGEGMDEEKCGRVPIFDTVRCPS